MKIDVRMARLICEMEECIGIQCYNPKSYNGWTGKEGCSYRYPVQYYNNGFYTKTKAWIGHIDPECIGSMEYSFGSNQLFIGDGIVRILKLLEDKYDLDFNQLLEKDEKDRKNCLEQMVRQIRNGEEVTICAGKRYLAGIDIPIGRIIVRNLETDCFNIISVLSKNAIREWPTYISKNDEKELIISDGDYIKMTHPIQIVRLCDEIS